MDSEIDVNFLVGIYNQRLNAMTSQNILLEAKIQSMLKQFEEDKNKLLMANLELQRKVDILTPEKPTATNKVKRSDYTEEG
jgi:hypothetical protein